MKNPGRRSFLLLLRLTESSSIPDAKTVWLSLAVKDTANAVITDTQIILSGTFAQSFDYFASNCSMEL
jgi:hypothetical protein